MKEIYQQTAEEVLERMELACRRKEKKYFADLL